MRSLRLLLVLAMLVACRRGKHGDAYRMERISAQGAHACAAMKDGTVRCWGRDGDKSVTTPALVAGVVGAADVCVGDAFSCVLGRAGAVSCLGQNVQNASALACGAAHVCAISAGKVLCWNASTPPREIASGATAIAAGGGTTCGLFDGAVRCWGAGKSGQLGDGTFEDRSEPVTIPGLHAKSIAVGTEHTCAVLDDETLACFGANDDGQLGDGTTEPSAKPRKVQNVLIARQVACGAHHTCARMGDSTVHCWGKNDVHQSGITSTLVITTPTLVPGLYESTAVVTGNDFTCVRMQDGWLRCFGVNDWGQLADGTHEIRNVPNPIHYD
jgi:alpha-tubulin suppressor-like RCC1 family protein